MSTTSSDRVRRFHARQKAAGMRRLQTWIPEDKEKQVKTYIKRLCTQHLNQQEGK